MDVYLFSDKIAIQKKFNPLLRSKKHNMWFYSVAEFRKIGRKLQEDSLCYLDFSLQKKEDCKRELKYLSRVRSFNYGIVDPKGLVDDVGDLFHAGAVDYIGKNSATCTVDSKRIEKIEKLIGKNGYRESNSEITKETEKPAHSYVFSGSDWSQVKPRREYTFCMMFVELDNKKEFTAKSSTDRTATFIRKFKEYLERKIAGYSGKIWMWKEFGGLILFPFDGRQINAVVLALELILERPIVSIEEFDLSKELSYRISLHLGNTEYQNCGTTGTIISESINFIFHLGQRYQKSGNFTITDEVFTFIPNKLKGLFKDKGSFEGHKIWRMRLPK